MESKQGEDMQRKFKINQPVEEYLSNEVKTTSSNIITFIPINLFHQLTNMANIYFILICILQVIPSISVTNGTPTQLIPLSAVIFIVMLKDAYEQYYRYKKDKSQNERLVEVWQNGRFQQKQWQSVKVGHVLKIKKQENYNIIPCDILIIKTSDSENKAYVQTKGLDGQTNLKIKNSFLMNVPNLSSYANQAYKKSYEVICSPPNKFFKEFNGFVKFNQGGKNIQIPLGHDNLILRGCISKNVHEVIGVCVYAGKDTKLFMNSAQFKVKKSKLMQNINTMVFQILIWQILIALICSVFNTLLQNTYRQIPTNISISNYWIVASTWWLLMTYFVPISLMVTMQMVKLFQGVALQSDQRGYSNRYNCFTIANNSSVNENLGQINYVFTDKTGTLTKNIMTFKYLICGGQLYGGKNEVQNDKAFESTADQKRKKSISYDSRLINSNKKEINQSFKLLSLCHDVYVQQQDGKVIYNSSSPDEKAIIQYAKMYNYELLGEKNQIISIAQGDGNRKQIFKYEKCAVLEFNSVRKRMSVIIKDPQTNQYILYTKGADSTMPGLLQKGKDKQKLQKTQDFVNKLSDEGLRTLLMAKRIIPPQQFSKWKAVYTKAKSMIGKNRQEAIDKCYESIQTNMQLVGATAIEDELQDDVADTIKTMRSAGMTFFILTGDKRQTAINIGRSCGLVDSDAQILDIPHYDPSKQKQFIFEIKKLDEIKQKKVFMLCADKIIPSKLPNGQIICYRCTPDNKKLIVEYYKVNFPGCLTMAVGDGANDVNMITEADVGIGIKGFEGTQAARVADFTAGQFKFIKLLTLYYGRQWYRKNCELALYSFFKNWLHVASVITLGGFTFFSGVMIFNTYLYELYNVIFTSWPIIIWSIFDEQYTYEQSNRDPQLYKPGLSDQKFNQTMFLKTVGKAMLYGVILLLLVINVLESQILDQKGNIGYMQLSGYVLYGIVIMIANFRILLLTTGIKPFIFIISILSIVSYWVSQSIYFSFISPQQSLILGEQFKYPSIFFVQFISIFFFIFIEFGIRKYEQFNYIFKSEKSKEMTRKLRQMQKFEKKQHDRQLRRFIVEEYL